jgi:hypothetical protein
VLAADPKLMELAYGRVIFDTYGAYAADPVSIADLFDQAAADMQARAAQFAGRQRDHTPTCEHPFTVVLVDEIAFLTAYQPDKNLRTRIMAALATLTTQGRAVGYAVVAARQDPRKDVLTIRNLFPDRIAMRLDEPSRSTCGLRPTGRLPRSAGAVGRSPGMPTPGPASRPEVISDRPRHHPGPGHRRPEMVDHPAGRNPARPRSSRSGWERHYRL